MHGAELARARLVPPGQRFRVGPKRALLSERTYTRWFGDLPRVVKSPDAGGISGHGRVDGPRLRGLRRRSRVGPRATADRGIVETTLRWLAKDREGVQGVRTEVFVSAVTSSLLMAGSPENVEAACAQVAERLLGEQRVGTVSPSSPRASDDDDVLWRRWGARSYGLLGLAPYALPEPVAQESVMTTLRLLNADTARAVRHRHRCRGTARAPPGWSEACIPARRADPHPAGARRHDRGSHVRCPGLRVRTSCSPISSSPARSPSASPGPRRSVRRWPCSAGTSAQEAVIRRCACWAASPLADEPAAIAAQLRRLRDEGPTETEIVQALDRLSPQPNESPVSAAMRMAWEKVTGVPRSPRRDGATRRRQSARSCPASWWSGLQMPALDEMAPPQPSPVDSSKLSGHTFRTAKLVTDGQGLEGSRLTVGAQGLSWRRARRRETIRAEDVAVIEVWADDDRSVLSRLGYRMHLDPMDWRRWEQLRSEVDCHRPGPGPGHRPASPRRQVRHAGTPTGPVRQDRPVLPRRGGSRLLRRRCLRCAELRVATRDRVLTVVLMLGVGGALCQNIWSIMVSVRRRQERARSVRAGRRVVGRWPGDRRGQGADPPGVRGRRRDRRLRCRYGLGARDASTAGSHRPCDAVARRNTGGDRRMAGGRPGHLLLGERLAAERPDRPGRRAAAGPKAPRPGALDPDESARRRRRAAAAATVGAAGVRTAGGGRGSASSPPTPRMSRRCCPASVPGRSSCSLSTPRSTSRQWRTRAPRPRRTRTSHRWSTFRSWSTLRVGSR